MIISPSRRFVFLHIPKTGGTALTLALESRARADDILIGDTPKARARKRRLAALTPAGRLWKHSTLADVAGVVPEDLTGWCVLTLVRNPWDRLLSYYHWLRAQSFDHSAVTLAKTLDFSAFLNHPSTRAAFAAWPAAAYTRDAAFAEFMEGKKGVLKAGLLADCVLLDGDIEATAPEAIADMAPVMTVMDGQVSYST